MADYEHLLRKPELHLSTYYPTPPVGVELCEGCGLKDFQANPPLKQCSGCNYVWFCSPECAKKKWKAHKPGCETVKRRRHLKEMQALSNPRQALLDSKLEQFVDKHGANEILLAAHLGPLHLSHPSLPRIDHSHVLVLEVEIDPDASIRPPREQYRLVNWALQTVEQIVRHGSNGLSDSEISKLTYRRAMMPDEAGYVDFEYYVLVSASWKGQSKLAGTSALSRGYGTWIKINKRGTEREYDAICDGWFEFLQQSMLGPAQQFRHLFDRKVDLATRSFDFGKLEEGKLPSRDSPGYQAAREAMFGREEEFRNMSRQLSSVQPRGLDGDMMSGFGSMIATRVDGSGTFATFHDGNGIVNVEVSDGQDLLEPGRKQRKKAKKDERKRQKQARAEAERITGVVEDDVD